MENALKNYTLLVEKVTLTLDLLEIAKGYCQYNFDKGQEIVALCSILEVILEAQRYLADKLDEMIQ